MTNKCNLFFFFVWNTKRFNMVTTIKITGDGVFIQTNSNRIHTTDERIVTDSSINVVNGINHNHRLNSGHTINISNKIRLHGIGKRSISVHNIDTAPQSLPNLPIANNQPALVSPHLVKTLSRIKKIPTPNSNNIVSNNSFSPSTLEALSTVSTVKSIHKVIRIDKSGKCTPRTPITSSARQWDGCITTNKKNGTVNVGATVRRRNTFKNYLIECKENIVRRLSSPTSLIG